MAVPGSIILMEEYQKTCGNLLILDPSFPEGFFACDIARFRCKLEGDV